MPMNQLRPWVMTVTAGMCYASLVGRMTWPSFNSLSQWLTGDNEEAWIFFWKNWWFRLALMKNLSLFTTPYTVFPLGVDLIDHSTSFAKSFQAFLLEPNSTDVDWVEGDLSITPILLPIPSGIEAGQYRWQIHCPEGDLHLEL